VRYGDLQQNTSRKEGKYPQIPCEKVPANIEKTQFCPTSLTIPYVLKFSLRSVFSQGKMLFFPVGNLHRVLVKFIYTKELHSSDLEVSSWQAYDPVKNVWSKDAVGVLAIFNP
jgi:hypothetical protein